MNKDKNNKGFTLIEIMVVIAIIGFLSAAILAAVGGARKNARDSQIKALVTQAISIVEANYDPTTAAYPGAEPTSSDWTGIEGKINNLNGAAGSLTYFGGPNAFAISAPLNNGKHYCVDADGAAKQIDAAVTATACP